MCPGHVTIFLLHFEHIHWNGSTDLWCGVSSLGVDGNPAVEIRSVCWMFEFFNFSNHRTSRNLWLHQYYESNHCHAKEEELWSTSLSVLPYSLLESLRASW
jgi:hypothetical protein